ncbi:sensor histidine kinase [Geodermatophilus arenarius]|uniref:Sensor histidine kinase n=1 Tax=Geodermatophilus arenarius TaxID=1137990 RepID=A0ABV9LMK5_9ACTN
MPTVARWWRDRSDPQRLDLYTRWSFYAWLGLTPAWALLVVAGAGLGDTGTARLYLAGSVLVAVTTVLLARAGLAARATQRPLPGRPLVADAVAAALASALGVAATVGAGADPEGRWLVVLPPAMLLTAVSPVWTSRALARAAAVVGLGVGALALASGEVWPAALVLAVTFAVAVTGLVLAFRFSVWVLDVVVAMERSRGVQLQLAVAEERLRFARDLHDVMGRDLSAIAVKSQLAGELVRRQRPEAADEVADISRIAERSLREVRDVVRGYRSTDLAGELAGARSVLRAAGIACTVHGEEHGAALPEPVQAALGWVVREAVTNVLRHSSAAECTVTLTAGDPVRLRVENDGAGRAGAGWGNGLRGLSERLAAASGRLSAGRHGDRFVVEARVPARAVEEVR